MQNRAAVAVGNLRLVLELLDHSGNVLSTLPATAAEPLVGSHKSSPFRIVATLPDGFATYRLNVTRFEPGNAQAAVRLQAQNTSVYVDPASQWLYLYGEVPNPLSRSIHISSIWVVFYGADNHVVDVRTGAVFRPDLAPTNLAPFRLLVSDLPGSYTRWEAVIPYAETTTVLPTPLVPGGITEEHITDDYGNQSLRLSGEITNTTGLQTTHLQILGTFYGEDGKVVNAGVADFRRGYNGILSPVLHTDNPQQAKGPFLMELSVGPTSYVSRTLLATYDATLLPTRDDVQVMHTNVFTSPASANQPIPPLRTLVGEAYNQGDYYLSNVRIVATMYDAQNRVVNSIGGGLYPAVGGIYHNILPPGTAPNPESDRDVLSPFKWPVYPNQGADHIGFAVDYQFSTIRPAKSLSLTISSTPITLSQGLQFSATVQNTGTLPVKNVHLFTTIYNSTGEVLNVSDNCPITGSLAPQESRACQIVIPQPYEGWIPPYRVQVEGEDDQ
ncbi:MAG: hypothetical protein EXR62_04825 [Chloroflexi bacterium]|nr:hypothetical protein [Chloroflexota bacterium]